MSKKYIALIVAVVLILAAVIGIVLMNRMPAADLESERGDTQVVQDTDPAPTNEENADEPDRDTGSYEDYSEEKLAASENENYIFFHAPWCPQCRALESDIQAQGLPAGVTVFKVDYDSNQKLRQKYGVTIQTTLVQVDSNGEKVGENYVAYGDPSVDALKKDLFN